MTPGAIYLRAWRRRRRCDMKLSPTQLRVFEKKQDLLAYKNALQAWRWWKANAPKDWRRRYSSAYQRSQRSRRVAILFDNDQRAKPQAPIDCNAKQFAALAGVHPGTLLNWRQHGMPERKPKKRAIAVNWSSAAAWVAAHRLDILNPAQIAARSEERRKAKYARRSAALKSDPLRHEARAQIAHRWYIKNRDRMDAATLSSKRENHNATIRHRIATDAAFRAARNEKKRAETIRMGGTSRTELTAIAALRRAVKAAKKAAKGPPPQRLTEEERYRRTLLRQRADAASLNDSYVRKYIAKEITKTCGTRIVRCKDVPAPLVEAYRLSLQNKRLIRRLQQ